MRWICFSILFVVLNPIWAQVFTLKGKITSNNVPIEFANVGIQELNKIVQSKANGSFELVGLPAGKFLLQNLRNRI